MKRIHAVIVFAFVYVFNFLNAGAQGKEVSYQEGDTQLKGLLFQPKQKGKQPGVVVIHAWMGITDHEKETARKLAEQGYVAFAADIYGDNVRPANPQEAGKQSGY